MKEAGVKPSAYRESQQKKKTYWSQQGKNVLQNRFLDDLLNTNKNVEVKSVNGESWTGHVKAYDDFSLLVETDTKQKELIFKHSVKSIKPVSRE